MANQPKAYTPPFDIEAEEWAVGAVLVNPDLYYTASYLQPDDFYHWQAQAVWQAIGKLAASRSPIDTGTLCKELGRAGAAVGPDYLAELVNCVPNATHLEYYARVVCGLSVRRKLMQAGARIVQVAYEEEDADLAQRKSWEFLQELRANGRGKRDVLEHNQTMEALFEHQVAVQKEIEEPSRGLLDTPWPQVNETIGRFEPGQVITIAAITSGGKTALTEQIMEHNAAQGAQAVYFHAEYPDNFMLQRRISRLSAVSFSRVRLGYNGEEIQEAMDKIARWPGAEHFIHCAGWGGGQIAAKIMELRARGMCDLVAVDYLQILRHDQYRGESKTDAISRTLGAIKEALEMTGVPGIVTSQLSREHERGSGSNRKPGLIDLRACGEIEEKSNAVAFLWPRCKYEHDYTGTDVDFYFRKPYGKEAEWTLFFDQDCLKHYMPICELGQGDFIL